MYKNLKKKSEGFTIIEVLIVLAIAGLILLIVFLAVPALQRNSRNTQRRNQVASYLGAVNEFVSNNNGALPTISAHVTDINNLSANGIMTEPTAAAPLTGAQTNATSVNGPMVIVTAARCDTSTVGNTLSGSPRQIALMFSVEGSNNAAIRQCQEG